MQDEVVVAIYNGPFVTYDAAAASAHFELYAELTRSDPGSRPTLFVRAVRMGAMKGMPRDRHFEIEAKDLEGTSYKFIAVCPVADHHNGRLELVEMH